MNAPAFRPLAPVSVTLLFIAAGVYLTRGAVPGDLFMPHSHCFLFNRDLIRLHGGSDFLIGASYVSISATLLWLVYRARKDLPFHWIMLAFALFIVACGATHFMEVWTLTAEQPRYWLSGWVKVVTAIASVTTAVVLPPLVPRVLYLMESARMSARRREELERAYTELNERYTHEHSRDLATMVRELAQAKAAAESAGAAKDAFLAALSHELRTPLTPVLMLATEMEQSQVLPEAFRSDFAMIRQNVKLEIQIIDDLLDLTRIRHGKLALSVANVEVHAIVIHALAILRGDIEAKRTSVKLDLAATAHHVVADAVRLQQVFWNMIKNAVKFTPQGGVITIRSWNEGGQLRVAITDNGLGITEEEMPRIFTAFTQGNEAAGHRFGGLGLGLSITAFLVREQRGRVWAESPGRDQGSTFHLEFPLAAATASHPPPLPAAPSSPGRSLRILLVEDHADTRVILMRLMTRWGHVITPAASVAEARTAIASGDFDLLLSDIGLPDGSGYDVIAALREKSTAPAVAMSGYGMDTDLARTQAAGFAEHIVKPVLSERLREILTRLAAQP